MITIEECKHIEELSKLKFTDEKREKFLKEFDSIVEFASIIQKESANADERHFNKINLQDLREDVARDGLSQDEVVSNAPVKKKGCFAVPRIVE